MSMCGSNQVAGSPSPRAGEEEEATDSSVLGSPVGRTRSRPLQEDSQAVSTESVPLVCKSANAHNLSSEKKRGPPARPVLQKSSASLPVPRRKRLDWLGKPRQPAWRSRPKAQKALPREKETNRKILQIQIMQRLKTLPCQTSSSHSEEPRKPQKLGIMKQQRPTPPCQFRPEPRRHPDEGQLWHWGSVPWRSYDLAPRPGQQFESSKRVDCSFWNGEKNPTFPLKEKSHPKPKAADLCQQSNLKSVDKAEVCPWESQGQSLFEERRRIWCLRLRFPWEELKVRTVASIVQMVCVPFDVKSFLPKL